MSEYNPDKWAIVKLKTPKQTLYKVMASWYGGYLGSDSWKLSSGIVSVKETEHTYEYTNYSGSVYICPKHAYGMSMYTASVYSSYEAQNTDDLNISIVDEDDVPGLKFDESNIS